MAPGAATTAKRAAVALDRLRPPLDGLTILIYHRVGGGSGSSVDLPTALFDEQVAFLAEHCRIYSLTEAADLLAADLTSRPTGGDPSRPCVALTFDDGTADFAEEALPVLARHGVPVTYYLATDFVDRQVAFPDGARPMTWTQAAEMVASGLVEVGSHTHTHALLDRVSRADAASELDRSIGAVEDHLGLRPQHFAYPKALLGSPQNEHEVRNRFRTEFDVVNVGDLGRLFPAGGDIGLEELVAKGAVRKNSLVKVLGDGKLTVSVNVTAHKFSGSARDKITAAGGSATELS